MGRDLPRQARPWGRARFRQITVGAGHGRAGRVAAVGVSGAGPTWPQQLVVNAEGHAIGRRVAHLADQLAGIAHAGRDEGEVFRVKDVPAP